MDYYPFIRPSDDYVTEVIIVNFSYHHEKVGHLGQRSVFLSLREGSGLVNGRSVVREC